MTIDSLFLLEFLHSYNDKVSLMKSSTGFNLVRSGGQKLTKDSINLFAETYVQSNWRHQNHNRLILLMLK